MGWTERIRVGTFEAIADAVGDLGVRCCSGVGARADEGNVRISAGTFGATADAVCDLGVRCCSGVGARADGG